MDPEQREKQETYQQSVDDVIALIGSNAQSGLSEAEAKIRQNELTSEPPTPAWQYSVPSGQFLAGKPFLQRTQFFCKSNFRFWGRSGDFGQLGLANCPNLGN